MPYNIAPINDEGLFIPSSVLNQIERLPRNKEVYFRVALFILQKKDVDIENIAFSLKMTKIDVEKAVNFWNGAGLLIGDEYLVPVINERKAHLTTKEVYACSVADKNVSALLQEAQSIFGEAISQGDANILVSMHINDSMPIDYILTALSHFQTQGLKIRDMKTIEKRLLKWLDSGIKTAKDIEDYIVLCDKRDVYNAQISEILHTKVDSFTYSEKCKIAQWFEKYAFTEPIISHAALVAGEKANVNYISGILKKWYAKGYRTVKDVLASENATNAVPQGKDVAPENDFVLNRIGVVPTFKK